MLSTRTHENIESRYTGAIQAKCVNCWAAALKPGDRCYVDTDVYRDLALGSMVNRRLTVTVVKPGRHVVVTDKGTYSIIELYLATMGTRRCRNECR